MRAYYTILSIHDPRMLVLIHPSRRTSADSPLPGARPMDAGLPPVVIPTARADPAGKPEVHLEERGIQE